MVPYKKFDLAIEAFNQLGLPLLVIGTGSEETKLKKMAKNNISFTRNISDEELISYYDRAKALIFPQEEDFGLIAAEAQARGTPVIGYQKGGAVDIIQSTKTGLLFQRQSVKSLKRAIYQFEKMKFDSKIIHKNALRFSKANFKNQLIEIINNI
jgi:glycosyltransferase involved in cell wall biosynthesis